MAKRKAAAAPEPGPVEVVERQRDPAHQKVMELVIGPLSARGITLGEAQQALSALGADAAKVLRELDSGGYLVQRGVYWGAAVDRDGAWCWTSGQARVGGAPPPVAAMPPPPAPPRAQKPAPEQETLPLGAPPEASATQPPWEGESTITPAPAAADAQGAGTMEQLKQIMQEQTSILREILVHWQAFSAGRAVEQRAAPAADLPAQQPLPPPAMQAGPHPTQNPTWPLPGEAQAQGIPPPAAPQAGSYPPGQAPYPPPQQYAPQGGYAPPAQASYQPYPPQGGQGGYPPPQPYPPQQYAPPQNGYAPPAQYPQVPPGGYPPR
jgi:hypothetical protein